VSREGGTRKVVSFARKVDDYLSSGGGVPGDRSSEGGGKEMGVPLLWKGDRICLPGPERYSTTYIEKEEEREKHFYSGRKDGKAIPAANVAQGGRRKGNPRKKSAKVLDAILRGEGGD